MFFKKVNGIQSIGKCGMYSFKNLGSKIKEKVRTRMRKQIN